MGIEVVMNWGGIGGEDTISGYMWNKIYFQLKEKNSDTLSFTY